jgi:hypothetical protein
MRPFFLGKEQRQQLKKIKEYAEANPYSMDDLLDAHNDKKLNAGHSKNNRCIIPVDFLIVYSIEETTIFPTNSSHFLRHLSIAIPSKDRLPAPETVSLVMEELGFKGGLSDAVKILKEEGRIHVWEFYK